MKNYSGLRPSNFRSTIDFIASATVKNIRILRFCVSLKEMLNDEFGMLPGLNYVRNKRVGVDLCHFKKEKIVCAK